MTDSSPIAETAQFVIKILSALKVSAADLPLTITNVRQTLQRLSEGKVEPAPLFDRTASLRARSRVADHTHAIASTRRAAPVAATPRPAPQPVIYAEKPRRGRPRRIPATIMPEPEIEVAQPEPQPRLLRRADAIGTEHDHSGDTPAVLRAPVGALRGVVKWYDGRAGKGALRLTGISGDVLLDPAILERSGIKRLYKDQEVEATVEDSAGRVRLVSLSLPGRSTEPVRGNQDGEVTGTLRRQPRPVTVVVKRDGVRQSAARTEAEHVFGGVGRIKANRRLTP